MRRLVIFNRNASDPICNSRSSTGNKLGTTPITGVCSWAIRRAVSELDFAEPVRKKNGGGSSSSSSRSGQTM